MLGEGLEEINVYCGAGGEACGYHLPERAVFKHSHKLPQH
jgi:hypothetical protein